MTEVCPTCPSGHLLGTFHDYQTLASQFLQGRDQAGLMLDMGLGKTAVVLDALDESRLPCLVVAPKRVAEETWPEEHARWRPDLSYAGAVGEPDARMAAVKSGADVVVIGRENIGKAFGDRKHPFKTVVIDELSGFKNKGSERWKSARRIVKKADRVWGLTGTPAPNGYLDLWGQIYLLDGGVRLGTSLGGYRSRYFTAANQIPVRGGRFVVTDWDLKPKADERIREKIEDICLAMTSKGRVPLPEQVLNKQQVRLPRDVMNTYLEMSEELAVDLEDLFGGYVHTAGNAAILTQKLEQISAGFMYVDAEERGLYERDYTDLHRSKMEALAEIVDSPHEGGVLVFYKYDEERRFLREKFTGKGEVPLVRFIDEPGIIKEWNRGEVPILATHPASASHGLNLQYGGHTIVWTGPTWDLELWDQANKRLHRQGQRNNVIVHLLLGKGTIDTFILKRVESKSETQQDLLAFLESPI